MKRFSAISSILALLLLLPRGAEGEEVKIESYTFGAIQARSIGPAAMSGRITAIDAVVDNPTTFYVGAAGGGVWKTIDGGANFKPVFDKHTQSIGAIAIDPANPQRVWVGTGECWVRNSVSVGDGIYRSDDGGDNWRHLGLADSERINKIQIHPEEADTVYVAALGHLWNANTERGVFKTIDGGKTWEKVLYVDENTGCTDLAMVPHAPGILYAAMWQFRRSPYSFHSGGPGSGLYRSTDGGKTWKKIHRGLPDGTLGRIAIAVPPTRPGMVYALVEAAKTALYRSTNFGDDWTRVSTSPAVNERPFYFSLLVPDPQDHQTLYKPGFVLAISKDGGETFEQRGGPHVDYHALWIHPDNPRTMILGTDGGVYISRDRGSNWQFLRDLPVSQFYHVSYDMADPYWVYGGLQDNGSWAAPSRSPGGIKNGDWISMGYGDGFYVLVDPKDRNIVYREYQGGRISRYHRDTGESKEIRPYPGTGEPEYRFNWNTPILVTDHALYVGAQFLFRSIDRGDSWEKISPDLTTDDATKQRQERSGGLTIDNTAAENHCTIYSISESPLDSNIIWAGTDDGNLQVTADGGKSWRNVASRIPGLPRHTWCSGIETSRFAPEIAYAVFDGHRHGDQSTYLFKTTDLGRTWTSLATSDIRGYAFVVREDLKNRNLLFLGTEFGLFLSLDGGQNWAQFTNRFPNVAVRDIAIHPREHDVIIATHGRGVYIMDDISLLRDIRPEVLGKSVHLFEPSPLSIRTFAGDYREVQPGEFVGRNAPEVAKIVYYLNRRHMFGDLRVEITNSKGEQIKTLPAGKRRGINIVEWYPRLKPPKVPAARELAGYALRGPMTPEGTYTVKLIKGKETLSTALEVKYAADYPHSREDRTLQQETVWKLYHMQEDLAHTSFCLTQLIEQIDNRSGEANKPSLKRDLSSFKTKLERLHRTLVATREDQGITGEEQLREKVVELYGVVNNFGGRPTTSQLQRMEALEKEILNARDTFKKTTGQDLNKINQRLKAAGLDVLTVPTREDFEQENQ